MRILYKSDDRIADSHSYLYKYEDRSHIQTHLSPDREEFGEDHFEESVTLLCLCSAVTIFGGSGRQMKNGRSFASIPTNQVAIASDIPTTISIAYECADYIPNT
eukprot:scaffold6574_cov261-Chaetoceros_neogracile.AAC.3